MEAYFAEARRQAEPFFGISQWQPGPILPKGSESILEPLEPLDFSVPNVEVIVATIYRKMVDFAILSEDAELCELVPCMRENCEYRAHFEVSKGTTDKLFEILHSIENPSSLQRTSIVP